MSKRSDIVEGHTAGKLTRGLVYTEVLGWIDLGHARGTDIKNFLSRIAREESSGRKFYDIVYSQGMNDPFGLFRMGKMTTWRIKRGRPSWEQKSIALAMMMAVAGKFEALQDTFPLNWLTDSGFSGEDLVSDLLGFYRVVSPHIPFEILRPVSKADALKRWDHYGKIGQWKNTTFRPLLFPDPEICPSARPRLGELPPFMRAVSPYNDFLSGNVIPPGRIKTFAIAGTGNGRMGL
ncbi:hypothetical protein LU604_06220 [Erwinia tracheiphila]|uniref:Uncharacterized protein n=1 Tax=Erwinia tracheiphila TaxID=65700 RepID=A0A345CTJ4_9GAMM|nr:hypothetical protein [Erwinia tracheiphila]AXF76761.1 hypothetical protein AV903_13075 [Erwinia tracheiphila]UIA84562.1 hypothetical protein LU604_06220 [Erwinia tracheiphila]UIA93155.1 hypothetical protein LU632_06205 [Erwinia tracheiphila]